VHRVARHEHRVSCGERHTPVSDGGFDAPVQDDDHLFVSAVQVRRHPLANLPEIDAGIDVPGDLVDPRRLAVREGQPALEVRRAEDAWLVAFRVGRVASDGRRERRGDSETERTPAAARRR
jgi:hypothetical protein